jgi:hypothetical protein
LLWGNIKMEIDFGWVFGDEKVWSDWFSGEIRWWMRVCNGNGYGL